MSEKSLDERCVFGCRFFFFAYFTFGVFVLMFKIIIADCWSARTLWFGVDLIGYTPIIQGFSVMFCWNVASTRLKKKPQVDIFFSFGSRCCCRRRTCIWLRDFSSMLFSSTLRVFFRTRFKHLMCTMKIINGKRERDKGGVAVVS